MANTLDGCIALTEHAANNVDKVCRLSPKMFGPPFSYVPFAGTPEAAFKSAMSSPKSLPQVATQPTVWYLLKVSLSADHVLELFQQGVLRQSTANHMHGWRHYGTLDLTNISRNWDKMTLSPLCLLQWADKALTGKFRLHASRTCTGCNGAGPVWASTAWYGRSDFCAGCWNAFLSERTQADGQRLETRSEEAGDRSRSRSRTGH